MTAAQLNVKLRSLLFNCEELAKDEENYWRLKKFIKPMETMIADLKECHEFEYANQIEEYTARMEVLKNITNYIDSPPVTSSSKFRQKEAIDEIFKEVKQLQNAKQYSDLRKELINDDNLRHRKYTGQESMGEAVKYYNETQEKIAEHMLALTRNLKEQTETANRIIKKDTELVSRSTGMTDRNINSLHKETEKLDDHSRNAWKCWMWLMIIFVIVIFIGMVLFMKIMKKKKV